MRIKAYHFLFMLIMMTGIWLSHSAWAEDIEAERKYPLISAYIYNFTQFTVWPTTAVKDTFTVCVLGQDPFGQFLNPIKSREVNGKKITIRRYSSKDSSLPDCNVLFISDSESGNVDAILAALRGRPVLTMSDIDGFSDAGGMVEFRPENGKIAISVNISTVKPSGISISSKLLSLVHIKE
jgi:hypothetical protein